MAVGGRLGAHKERFMPQDAAIRAVNRVNGVVLRGHASNNRMKRAVELYLGHDERLRINLAIQRCVRAYSAELSWVANERCCERGFIGVLSGSPIVVVPGG